MFSQSSFYATALHWQIFRQSNISKKKFMTFFYITYHCFECFIHQCFFIHISHVFLLLETSHEHENYINQWNINDIIEEHFSIFFIYLVIYEHRFIFFYHYWFIRNIDHFVCKRYFVHESFEIINERIITIKIVYHAFSKRIVECLFNWHTRIFRCFQTCYINKFNIRRIIICVFVIINSLSFSLFFSFLSFDLLLLQFSAMISFKIFVLIMRLMTLKINRHFLIEFLIIFLFKAFFFIQKILHSWLYVSIFWIYVFYHKRIV